MNTSRLKLLRSSPAPAHPVLSAKTMVPRQGERIHSRKRLLSEVGTRLDRGHLWIGAPPGAGKTVLAADFAASCSRPVAWYEFDLLDTDPAAFFAAFPKAFIPLFGNFVFLKSLPRLQPEDMLALPIFARKFFRALFSDLSGRWHLILDNCQEIPGDSPFLELVEILIRELPLDCRAVLLSRQVPPPAFAGMKSQGLLQVLAADALALTREEIGRIMALHGLDQSRETTCIDYLHSVTAGWAAGLTLLLEGQNREICADQAKSRVEHQELFDYFTGVLFAKLKDQERDLLIRAALMPDIRPKLLDRLHGGTPCQGYFLRLSRNNFFTYSLDAGGELFQFHPLFREFLQKQARNVCPAETLARTQEQVARILCEEGRIEEAVELLIRAEHWPEAIRYIQTIGMRMLKEGRFKTLIRWRDALPEKLMGKDPWLLFFFGNAVTAFDPVRAIAILKQSFTLFQEQDDTSGSLLACSSLTNSIINHLSNLSALDPWLDYLEQELDPATFPRDREFANITISNAIFRALVLHRPAHPDLEAWLRIVVEQGGMHPALITHYLWTGRFAAARSALDQIYARQDQIGSKLQLSAIKAMEVQYYLIMARQEKCLQVIDESLAMIEETGIRVWEVHFLILGAGCCLNCGDSAAGREYLRRVEAVMPRARLLERSYYHVVKTLAALLDDDLVAADRHQQAALDMAATIGMPSYDIWCWHGSALVAVFQGRHDAAVERFDRVFFLAGAPGNPWFTCQAHLGLAYMYLRQGERRQAASHLRRGFSLAREHNYVTFFFFVPKMMEAIAVAALEEGIEEEFVCRFIEHWQLRPAHPPVHLSNWPWPLRIFTLGRFAVLCHGKKLTTKLLARNKPIQLLQAIIALGGRQVSKTRLADIFWPDSNGDEQAAALKITLHRLRTMLGVEEAITQTSTHLTLNPSVCWVDCWQFERQAHAALESCPDGKQDEHVGVLGVKTYQGDFLAAYRDDPWLFSYRNRLRELYERLLPLAG